MARLNLAEIAKKEVTFSELIIDKTIIENDDIIKYHPDGITIYAADRVSVGDSDYYVYLIKEEPTKFGSTGIILTKILDRIMAECEGDIETFNTELKQGLKVKLVSDKTKDKKPIYKVEVVG